MKSFVGSLVLLITLYGLFPVTQSCKHPTDFDSLLDTIPTISQGIYGKVLFWEGDFMPVAGAPRSGGTMTPVRRLIYVHTPTRKDSTDAIYASSFFRAIYSTRIDSVWSDTAGFYQIALRADRYSLFVREDSLYYCGGGDGQGYYWPVTVVQDSLTRMDLNILYKASF